MESIGPKNGAVSRKARLAVYSSLFPNAEQPNAGLFVRARMFRVGKELPLIVVSPKPWFPFQGLLRLIKPGYRRNPGPKEIQDDIEVYFPRFLSFPGLGRSLDGLSMAVCTWPLMRKLRKQFRYEIIDSHFAYPDGYAATLLAKWLKVKCTITLRGTEVPIAKHRVKRALMLRALARADRVLAVADALKQHVSRLGADENKIQVVGNGVDLEKFEKVSKKQARERLGLSQDAKVLVSVGGLVPRKGFHRVMACLPSLLKKYPDLHYLVVGGASPEGDMGDALRRQAQELRLGDRVRFLGALPPDELKWPLSAADVFVLSTSNEGWANVFLEAMACGLPVVTTDVGGNKEVVNSVDLGYVVPFGDQERLVEAIEKALSHDWDAAKIINYAKENSWNERVSVLVREFQALVHRPVKAGAEPDKRPVCDA